MISLRCCQGSVAVLPSAAVRIAPDNHSRVVERIAIRRDGAGKIKRAIAAVDLNEAVANYFPVDVTSYHPARAVDLTRGSPQLSGEIEGEEFALREDVSV